MFHSFRRCQTTHWPTSSRGPGSYPRCMRGSRPDAESSCPSCGRRSPPSSTSPGSTATGTRTAPPAEVYVSELVNRLAGSGFRWQELEPLTRKGKARPGPAFALAGTAGLRSRRAVRYTLPVVGRSAELARLGAALADAEAGRG